MAGSGRRGSEEEEEGEEEKGKEGDSVMNIQEDIQMVSTLFGLCEDMGVVLGYEGWYLFLDFAEFAMAVGN